jgi:phage tail sheath protein FI
VIAPPAGYVAGVIAATDLKPGGGVHKAPANEQVLGVAELVTSISDREQAALNVKGINIIRHRPFAGIRIWGARTIAADPLWNYINVRRLFLMVERSVRDAIQWAVFLPNTPTTRSDLKSTIAAFLYRLYSQGMLDGATWKDAFSVQCDSKNNPDVDVRSGLLTVDVEIRPVYPAEFIRVRFRQSPVKSEVTEG